MDRLLFVCLGGAVGSGARYLVSLWAVRALGHGFPYGTLIVNVVGSFLLGVLVNLGPPAHLLGPAARLGLTVGVMGGFTTYSTFSYETLAMLHEGSWALAGANIAGTVLACLAASMAGLLLGRALASALF